MTTITHISQLDFDKVYSYADYLTWQFDDMVEVIKGKVMLMSPAPNLRHQDISRNLLLAIGNYLHHKSCKVFHAPFDVKLYGTTEHLADNRTYSVVQPDLCVVCDKNKLTTQGCDGAPELIIEIVSKGNSKKDLLLKYDLYQENGVGEYWLVYPYEEAIHQFVLDPESERYQLHQVYAQDGIIRPCLFPELEIDLTEIFAD